MSLVEMMMILQDMTQEQLIAKIVAMQAAGQRKLSLKVSDKGAVSLYGLGRFPVTLYGTQWDKLLGEAEHIKAFMESNRALLSTKD